jgi:excinuclease ABC subunit A
MQFLPDVYVTCEVCGGSRFNSETLEVKFKDKNISQILSMTVEEAAPFLQNIPGLHSKLNTLHEVGLSYVRLGQPAPQLSGGEAQRVKLATELSKRGSRDTVYILDEPTTGLHFADLEKLIKVLQELVTMGNTVLVIEHNLDIVKNADWIIDLGPEGGDGGGQIIAEGTVKDVANAKQSYTGQYLKKVI